LAGESSVKGRRAPSPTFLGQLRDWSMAESGEFSDSCFRSCIKNILVGWASQGKDRRRLTAAAGGTQESGVVVQ